MHAQILSSDIMGLVNGNSMIASLSEVSALSLGLLYIEFDDLIFRTLESGRVSNWSLLLEDQT